MKYIPGTAAFVVLILIMGSVMNACHDRDMDKIRRDAKERQEKWDREWAERHKPDGPPWTIMKSDDGVYNFTNHDGNFYLDTITYQTREAAQSKMDETKRWHEQYERAKARKYTPVTE